MSREEAAYKELETRLRTERHGLVLANLQRRWREWRAWRREQREGVSVDIRAQLKQRGVA